MTFFLNYASLKKYLKKVPKVKEIPVRELLKRFAIKFVTQ